MKCPIAPGSTRVARKPGSSASLDHIITWNLTCTNTCTMQSSTSKVHWVGAECNDHALISCTVGGDLLTYHKGQVVGGRPGELKLKKIDPKQLPRIQSKLCVITSPIAQETRRSYMAGECSAEQAMVQMIAVRVATAKKLMHENPEGQSNRAKRQFISFDFQFLLNIRNKYLSFCSWPKSNSFT